MAPLNDINFEKTNGGMGRTAASEDPISGLIMELPELTEAMLLEESNRAQFEKTANLYIAKLRYPEQLEDYGLVKQSMLPEDVVDVPSVAEYMKRAAVNAVVYHVSEFFRMSPNGTLYLCIKNDVRGVNEQEDIHGLQNYANGTIRKMGVFSKAFNCSMTQDTAINLELTHKPLSILGTKKGIGITFLQFREEGSFCYEPVINPVQGVTVDYFSSTTPKVKGCCNVSLLISCDLDPELIQSLGQYAYYGCVGTCLGAMSKAAVNECIAWVQKFPLSLKEPGFVTGDLLSSVSHNVLSLINENRYIFVLRHVGDDNNYFNDSHTLDLETSDYAYIENVQTIDKACREIRKNLLPYLNSPLLIDANSGKVDPSTVAFLETTAGRALEDMEKAGELSGYSVTIDPDQNVLSTSELEFVIKQVATGVMRRMRIKIGYTTKL